MKAVDASELVICNADTGHLTWRTTRRGRNGKSNSGDRAGSATLSNGYLRISLFGKSYLQHHIVWLLVYGELPVLDIDHINGIKTDNRIHNLRQVSRSVHLQNLRQPKRNGKSGFLGVSLFKRTGKYTAEITVNYKKKNLGYFDSAEQASEAYLSEKRKVHEGCTI